MEKISINSIFSQNSSSTGKLDVNTICDTNRKQREDKIKFSVDRLIQLRRERKKIIDMEYEKQYDICLNEIELANKIGMSKIAFEVPLVIYGFKDYHQFDCLEYIQKKLQRMKFDTVIISNSQILISWEDIESNVKNS